MISCENNIIQKIIEVETWMASDRTEEKMKTQTNLNTGYS